MGKVPLIFKSSFFADMVQTICHIVKANRDSGEQKFKFVAVGTQSHVFFFPRTLHHQHQRLDYFNRENLLT